MTVQPTIPIPYKPPSQMVQATMIEAVCIVVYAAQHY